MSHRQAENSYWWGKRTGKYWMYRHCTTRDPEVNQTLVATSDNMFDWQFLRGPNGQPVSVLPQQGGYFDSSYLDPVAAVVGADGILFIYNGINAAPNEGGAPRRMQHAHYPAQELFDRHDPSRCIGAVSDVRRRQPTPRKQTHRLLARMVAQRRPDR
jgi:hypothetical protein